MIQKRILIPVILILAGALLFPAVTRSNKVFPVSAQGGLTLKNVNGKIELSTHDRGEIRVIIEKIAATKKELDEVKVRMNVENDHLNVDVKRLKRTTKTRVNFQVVVPRGLGRVELESVNGRVYSRGDLGALTLESVNGSVNQKGLFSKGSFSTVNGSIEVVHPAALAGGISARSVNGAIQLEVAKSSDFQVNAATMNGSIRTDFKLPVNKRLVGKSVHGSVGTGKHVVQVKTVNGGIKILAI